jgi:hypothetical protein
MSIQPLSSWPVAFDAQAQKINELIAALEPIINAQGLGTVKIVKSDTNWVIQGLSAPADESGLPSGYGPEEWTVYDGGVVTTRNFLTDNPD